MLGHRVRKRGKKFWLVLHENFRLSFFSRENNASIEIVLQWEKMRHSENPIKGMRKAPIQEKLIHKYTNARHSSKFHSIIRLGKKNRHRQNAYSVSIYTNFKTKHFKSNPIQKPIHSDIFEIMGINAVVEKLARVMYTCTHIISYQLVILLLLYNNNNNVRLYMHIHLKTTTDLMSATLYSFENIKNSLEIVKSWMKMNTFISAKAIIRRPLNL